MKTDPLPWSYTLTDSMADDGEDTYVIQSPEGDVAEVCSPALAAEGNAAMIVRAVNSHERLLAACEAFVQAAKDAHEHWDADRDAKVGKLLSAMAGHLTNYRRELTEAHAAIAAARGE